MRVDLDTMLGTITPLRKGEPMTPERAKRYLSVSFPARHLDAAFAQTALTPAQCVWTCSAKRAVAQRSIALLHGPRGTGKTFLATRIARDWCQSGCNTGEGRVKYWRLIDLFGAQLAWFDRKHDDNGNAIPEPLGVARTCGLLILDEIHDRLDTDYARSELTRLIDVRYAEKRPTVLITNRHSNQISGVIGVSAAERILEGGCAINCTAENIRKEISEKLGGTKQ
jgi:DNA replication protein DnaC